MKCPGEIGARQAVKPESRVTPRSDAWRFLLWVMYCRAKSPQKRKQTPQIGACFDEIRINYARRFP
jgi:hypothetical protein